MSDSNQNFQSEGTHNSDVRFPNQGGKITRVPGMFGWSFEVEFTLGRAMYKCNYPDLDSAMAYINRVQHGSEVVVEYRHAISGQEPGQSIKFQVTRRETRPMRKDPGE